MYKNLNFFQLIKSKQNVFKQSPTLKSFNNKLINYHYTKKMFTITYNKQKDKVNELSI